ncbi:hypothetical protein BG011_003266 [Mortierella polycephala]|uniref:Uncharacterized protein n=1 Tax=Mortierella polycephala TaxID=41804 RepID=A0A9P6Q1B1_9FUNG|nr:hypothetical protein BG011_003266 [Mortierella polycephala]
MTSTSTEKSEQPTANSRNSNVNGDILPKMPRYIFLDSGGVINDNDRRAPQWVDHLEEYMPKTCIGGPPQLWGRANATLSSRLFIGENRERDWDRLIMQATDFKDFSRKYYLYWLQGAVELVNELLREEYEQEQAQQIDLSEIDVEPRKLVQLELPGSEEEQIQIAHEAHMYCTARVQADYPGAVDAILRLKFEQKFEMFTCSGETATELELTFRTLGISTLTPGSGSGSLSVSQSWQDTESGSGSGQQDFKQETMTEMAIELQPVFTKLYGPDLINCHKGSSQFYALIFQDSGVDPHDAVVVDDKEYILGWAKVHGARTVMISDKDRKGNELMVELEEEVEDGGVKVVRKRMVLAVDHQLSSLAELPELTAEWRRHHEQQA